MSRRHFLDDSIAQFQTKEKGNFRKSHKFHQLDYRFSVKKARRRIRSVLIKKYLESIENTNFIDRRPRKQVEKGHYLKR